MNNKPIDRTNKRYGYLTAIEIVPKPSWSNNKKKCVFWKCKCDCGNEIVRVSADLSKPNRKNQSCGCKDPTKLKDLSNKKIGRWTVLHFIGRRNRVTLWRCRCDCGNERNIGSGELKFGRSTSCGCYSREQASKRCGENSPVWKGGVTYQLGYRLILSPNHPNTNNRGYVREHILVMSKCLGRPLDKKESVHHKDGNKLNNEISNLELWNSKHPGGQRVEDMIIFAWTMIDKYDPEHKRSLNLPISNILYSPV